MDIFAQRYVTLHCAAHRAVDAVWQCANGAGWDGDPHPPSRGRLLQAVWAVQSVTLSSARLCVVAGTCLGVLALIVVRECFQRKRLNRSYNPNVTCVRLQFAGIVDVVF